MFESGELSARGRVPEVRPVAGGDEARTVGAEKGAFGRTLLVKNTLGGLWANFFGR
jgi:hypothetical protein